MSAKGVDVKQKNMARKIEESFFYELKTGTLKPLLEYVQNDDTLDMELRGNSVMIYYRGGKILEIKDKSYKFSGLNRKYLLDKKNIESPSLATFASYFPQAKHIIDYYVLNKKNHLWEKEIQQRIVQENNYSPNALDTDFFVIDVEYQDNSIGSRADIVALRWCSNASARGLENGYLPKITIFEVKQGKGSISGKSGMSSHLDDFNAKTKVDDFKQDMIAVFKQKRELGLIIAFNENKYEVTEVENEIDFVFLLTNYKSASGKLEQELEKMDSCKFIYANPMGYGLYAQNIIEKEEFKKRFFQPKH